MPPSDLEILSSLYGSIVEGGAIEHSLELLAQRFDCPAACFISFDAAAPKDRHASRCWHLRTTGESARISGGMVKERSRATGVLSATVGTRVVNPHVVQPRFQQRERFL